MLEDLLNLIRIGLRDTSIWALHYWKWNTLMTLLNIYKEVFKFYQYIAIHEGLKSFSYCFAALHLQFTSCSMFLCLQIY